MSNGAIRDTGWATTVRVALQMLGHTGLIIIAVIVLVYVAGGGRLPGQAIASPNLITRTVENQSQIIQNQQLIIQLLNENQKVAYRQSVILDSIAHTLERMEDR
jgi:hypothetical protein